MRNLGTLSRVDLREYWEDEARDLTPWLAQSDNLRRLGEAIGMPDLEPVGTEKWVGNFKADILARSVDSDDLVIIENQLEKTNHDHLGKLITYASGLGAKAIIWIAREFCEEHRKALDWLNDITEESIAFFGLEIELWRIGSSDPAPRFNLVCQPNEWAKQVKAGGIAAELGETKILQFELWSAFVEFCKEQGTTLSLRKPRYQFWYAIAVGRVGFEISLTANARHERVGCELYMKGPEAKRAFDELAKSRKQIEAEANSSLEWQRLEGRAACRIVEYRPANIQDRDNWHMLFRWLKERAEVFHRVFSPRVKDLDLEEPERS